MLKSEPQLATASSGTAAEHKPLRTPVGAGDIAARFEVDHKSFTSQIKCCDPEAPPPIRGWTGHGAIG